MAYRFKTSTVLDAATLLDRVPQAISMAQIDGAGAYYVLALTSGGAVVAGSETLISTGNAIGGRFDSLDVLLTLIEESDVPDVYQFTAAALVNASVDLSTVEEGIASLPAALLQDPTHKLVVDAEGRVITANPATTLNESVDITETEVDL